MAQETSCEDIEKHLKNLLLSSSSLEKVPSSSSKAKKNASKLKNRNERYDEHFNNLEGKRLFRNSLRGDLKPVSDNKEQDNKEKVGKEGPKRSGNRKKKPFEESLEQGSASSKLNGEPDLSLHPLEVPDCQGGQTPLGNIDSTSKLVLNPKGRKNMQSKGHKDDLNLDPAILMAFPSTAVEHLEGKTFNNFLQSLYHTEEPLPSRSGLNQIQEKPISTKNKRSKKKSKPAYPNKDSLPTTEKLKSFSEGKVIEEIEEVHVMRDGRGEILEVFDKKMVLELEKEYVRCLTKRSDRFPEALFFCKLCNYHCDRIGLQRHLTQGGHQNQRDSQNNEALLRNLPHPSELQTQQITALLEEIAKVEGLFEEDILKRQEVLQKLISVIGEKLPDLPCKFQLFGSSVTEFGLKCSDVNVDMSVPTLEVLANTLCQVFAILKEEKDFMEVKSEFEAKCPRICFVHKTSGLIGNISSNNTSSLNTSRLLYNYAIIDPRVKILGVAIRSWAKICCIDRQSQGTLPSHAYLIMLIHFLQQCHPPVVPVLHELKKEGNQSDEYTTAKQANEKWTCQNRKTVGELFIDFFRFYSVNFPVSENIVCIRQKQQYLRSERKWDGKIIAIEDPTSRKRNLSRSISNQHVYRHIVERIREAYKYFAIPQLKTGPLYTDIPEEYLSKARKKNSKNPNVETPESSQKSPNKTQTSGKGNPPSKEIKREPGHVERSSTKFPSFSRDSFSSEDAYDYLEDVDPDLSMDEMHSAILELTLADPDQLRSGSESSEEDKALSDQGPIKDEEDEVEMRPLSRTELYVQNLMSSFKEEDLFYQFNNKVLTQGKLPPVFCRLCQQKGHLKEECPSQILPEVKPLPPLSESHKNLLDNAAEDVMNMYLPQSQEIRERQKIISQLEFFIQDVYQDAKLEVFGSSCNGFGFVGSDMDICLTFSSIESCGAQEAGVIIEKLASHLLNHKHLVNILPIKTAKVPIVKFQHKPTGLECDISLYNLLAQHNTRMLKLYSKIDPRVQILGYTIKSFAKLCDIGDASRGSLSSYAYILMVLHFLQQRNPPVIPCLQELYDQKGKKPEVLVDGWNAWFFDDLDQLGTVWPQYKMNRESVGELWLGLLRYYTEDFNFKEMVISIRQLAPLTKFEKFWNSESIAIEDPFDLSHNLGVGLSGNMNIYIRKAFIRGREVFGHPPRGNLRDSAMVYFFDSNKLLVEKPPNDHGCRICGKIGHKMKDCTNQKRRRGRNSQDGWRDGQRDPREQRDGYRDQKDYRDNYREQRDGYRDHRDYRDNRNQRDFRDQNYRPENSRSQEAVKGNHPRNERNHHQNNVSNWGQKQKATQELHPLRNQDQPQLVAQRAVSQQKGPEGTQKIFQQALESLVRSGPDSCRPQGVLSQRGTPFNAKHGPHGHFPSPQDPHVGGNHFSNQQSHRNMQDMDLQQNHVYPSRLQEDNALPARPFHQTHHYQHFGAKGMRFPGQFPPNQQPNQSQSQRMGGGGFQNDSRMYFRPPYPSQGWLGNSNGQAPMPHHLSRFPPPPKAPPPAQKPMGYLGH